MIMINLLIDLKNLCYDIFNNVKIDWYITSYTQKFRIFKILNVYDNKKIKISTSFKLLSVFVVIYAECTWFSSPENNDYSSLRIY